jgi:hypothetical protein
MATETKDKKIYEPETIDEEELPEGIIWETIVDKPSTLSELSAADGERLDTVETEVVNGFADVAIQGWMFDGAMSATDHDTVAWASGTLRFTDGTTYSIAGGNTGTMAAITYIYFDLAVSTTAFQTTTTAANAVGTNKLLVGVAQNVTSGKDATFQAFGGKGGVGVLLTADNIAANSITANEIQTNTITSLTLTSGTITGALVRTSSGSKRVQLNDSTNALEVYLSSEKRIQLDGDELTFFNSAGAERGGIYADTTEIYIHALNGGNLILESEGSLNGIFLMCDSTQIGVFGPASLTLNEQLIMEEQINMQDNDIIGINELVFTKRTGNPNRDGELLHFDDGADQAMLVQMDGTDYSFDLSFA